MAYGEAKTGQAKSPRTRMTSAERRLWSRLRAKRFHGLVWLRQEPFGKYIVDFYCPVARLVVELDGEAHGFTTRQDAARQVWIEAQGATGVRGPKGVGQIDIDQVRDELYRRCIGHLPLPKPAEVHA